MGRINRARFLVGELTDRNPNVFYELDVAHALSKDVILLTQSMDFVPFDLKSLRCLTYEFTSRGIQRLEKVLSATVTALMKIVQASVFTYRQEQSVINETGAGARPA